MFKAMSLCLAAFGLVILALTGAGKEAYAQGNCDNCDLPPNCRENGDGNGNGNGSRHCQPIRLTIESDLDFGRIVLLNDGGMRVVLDLVSGRKTVIGNGDDLGGMVITGRAIVTGAPFEAVEISLPNEIAMRDTAGGQARLNDFVTDLDGFPRLDANGQLQFVFSATLVIDPATNASGNLRGRIPISVEYP